MTTNDSDNGNVWTMGDGATVTEDQIDALSTEAAEAGDLDMVELCKLAGGGDAVSLHKVARALSNARAQQRSAADVQAQDA